MAKKSAGEGKSIDLFKLLKKVDNGVEILSQSTFSNIKEWISTGNYILNACLSGDLYKGIPTGRITFFAGESGCLEKNEKVGIYLLKDHVKKHEQLKEFKK